MVREPQSTGTRGTLVGSHGAPFTYRSEPFEAGRFDSINVEFRVLGLIGTSPTVDGSIETAADMHTVDADWTTVATFTSVTAANSCEIKALDSSDMSQFVRGVITINGDDHVATCSRIGIARAAAG